MTIYKYYSIIEWIPEDSIFSVTFPDIENCFTDGENIADAISRAEDVLELMLSDDKGYDNHKPKASLAKDIQIPEGASLVQIVIDTDEKKINEDTTYLEEASLHFENVNEDTDIKEEQLRALYGEFVLEKDMNFVMNLEPDNIHIERHKEVIGSFLKYAELKGQCTYFQKDNLFEIDAKRYIIKILVIHSGDACGFTINKRTGNIVNRRRMLYTEATENYLETYL
ncbi:type II toxin-antitoxin system HicB family antitoxin [Peribacillus sp. NPDC097675]|uniref:type II toxin-antitoxin system HicB family antitoxin n=1 Tax=Peribacillus sp. NPDC097675 TaxID=3390618 RepID=UPI003CFD2022